MAPADESEMLGPVSVRKFLFTRRFINSEPAEAHSGLPLNVDYTPVEVFKALTARDVPAQISRAPDHSGAVDPTSINMKGVQALFAIIGASFVLGSIWFFFWAKNGGFQWRKGDWDEYKSTVLRRKGPNGTTLSNATKSTKLGGGSVVGGGFSDRSGTTISGSVTDETMTQSTETLTVLSSEAPIMKEKQKAKAARRETAKDRKIREVREETWEGGHDEDMRAYRHEKPARVGGINKDSEAQYYGTDYTETDSSIAYSQPARSVTGQTPTPGLQRQSRSRQHSPEKRQQPRRDFSYGNDEPFSTVSSSQQSQPDRQPRTQQPPSYNQGAPAPPPHRPGRYHTSQQTASQSQPQQQQYTTRVPQYPTSSRPTSTNIPGAYQASETSVSDVQNQNTKSYHHPLPRFAPTANNNNNGGHAYPHAQPQTQAQGQGRGYRRDRSDSLDE